MEKAKGISFAIVGEDLVIRLSADLLKFATENRDDGIYKVNNKMRLLKEVKDQLEDNQDDSTGLTGFQQLLEDAVDEVVTLASDSVEYSDLS